MWVSIHKEGAWQTATGLWTVFVLLLSSAKVSTDRSLSASTISCAAALVVKRLASGALPSAERRNQMIHEARVLSRLDHANVLRVYDYSELDEYDVFTFEYLEGTPLVDALAAGLEFAKKVRVATVVASVLSVAHRNGIVHGALSPRSVVNFRLAHGSTFASFTMQQQSRLRSAHRVVKSGQRWRGPTRAAFPTIPLQIHPPLHIELHAFRLEQHPLQFV